MIQKRLRFALMMVAALVAALPGWAQTVGFGPHAEGKSLRADREPQFIGTDGASVVLVETQGRVKPTVTLVRYGMDQQVLASAELGPEQEVNCYGGFVNGEYIDLLRTDFGEGSMRVYRDRRRLATLEPVGEPLTLGEYHGVGSDGLGVSISASADQRLLAVLYVAQRESQGTEVHVGLYSRELEEYWKMESRARTASQMYVSDSGDVVLAHLGDRKATLSVLDGEHEASYSFATERNYKEYMVARFDGRRLLLAGTYSTNPPSSKWVTGTNVNSVDMLCCDLEDNELRTVPFTIGDQDFNRVCNEKDNAKVRSNNLTYGSMVQCVADGEGCYVMIDNMWRTLTDGRPTDAHRVGMLVVRTDGEGRVQWTRAYRTSQSVKWTWRSLLGYRWVRTPKGILWAYADSPDNTSLRDPSRPCDGILLGRETAVLKAVTLNADGDGSAFTLPIGKQGLVGALHQADAEGRYLALCAGGTKGMFVTLELK